MTLATLACAAVVACRRADTQPPAPETAPVVAPTRGPALPEGQEPAAPRGSDPGAGAISPGALREIQRSLSVLGSRFGRGFQRASRLTTGSLEARGTRRYAFPVEGGSCYRVMAVATAASADLDVTLADAAGVEIEADTSYGTTALLGLRQPLCFQVPGVHRLEVSLPYAAGSFALDVFRGAEGVSAGPFGAILR